MFRPLLSMEGKGFNNILKIIMRELKEIILHCTATKEGQDYSVEQVRRWHLDRGFNDIGYHFLIRLDGTVEAGRPLETVGAHCKGHNANSIGIAYVGGLDKNGRPKDTRTLPQKESMRRLVYDLKQYFPRLVVHCHNEYSTKSCPCFSVSEL